MRISVVIIIFSFAANIVFAMLLLKGQGGYFLFPKTAAVKTPAVTEPLSEAQNENATPPAGPG